MAAWGALTFSSNVLAQGSSCNCIGPQPGFPRCPCLMRGVEQRDGRWVAPEKDLGPIALKEGYGG
tara:strand:+ start:917 stop:1111 length:195 start_codon:yes stop_codon:yes gene_type:complete